MNTQKGIDPTYLRAANTGWDRSNRTQRLPHDWTQRRELVKAAAQGQCQATLHNGQRCTAAGTDCDHIQAGDNHSLANLQWLCSWHHRQKTAREARLALEAAKQKNQFTTPKHPGLLS